MQMSSVEVPDNPPTGGTREAVLPVAAFLLVGVILLCAAYRLLRGHHAPRHDRHSPNHRR